MRKIFIIISLCCLVCNGLHAQSLGKMTLGCKRSEIPYNLPTGFSVCKNNSPSQLTYATSKGDEFVSFYLKDYVVYKIEMHKYVGYGSDPNLITSKLEEIIMELYDSWGEPSYVGENIYWQFPGSKATFSYTVSTSQAVMDPLRYSGSYAVTTFYKCYADIKLEKKGNLFE